MGVLAKIVWVAGVVSLSLCADLLEENCLQCHKKQQIPTGLIYKRYLMKYSTPERISNAIESYLQHPQKKHSIMPPQFFLKFPMKEPTKLSPWMLRESVRAFIKRYDVRRRLVLPE